MVLKVFSIRDSKAEVYNMPFYQKTMGEAERSFRQAAMDEKTTLSKYPEDYDLYYLGEYDDNSGKLIPKDTPEHIMKAVDALAKN